jgi:hypothetical protein
MCGIFTLLNNKDSILDTKFIKQQADKAQHRGPDNHKIQTHNLKNTEFIGQADPYIILKDEEGQEIGRTFTAQDKGGSVLFDYLDIRTRQEELLLYNEKYTLHILSICIAFCCVT